MKETSSERYYRLKNQGLCVRCGKPNDTKYILCSKCSAKRDKARKNKKEAGICVECGKAVEDGCGVLCLTCANKYKETYKWKKEHKICTECGSNPACPGKTRCAECALKAVMKYEEQQKSISEDGLQKLRNKQKEYNRERAAERKANGLCVKCGRKALDDKTLCLDCSIRDKKYMREYRAKTRKDHESLGECMWCNNKPLPNKRYCKKHYEQVCKNLEIARNHPSVTANREKYNKEKINVFWTEMKYNRQVKNK